MLPAEGEKDERSLISKRIGAQSWADADSEPGSTLTLKGVNILASSLLKRDVQLFPPHTLNTQVSEAKRKNHLLMKS